MKHLKINKDVEIDVADNEYLELIVLKDFIDHICAKHNLPEASLPSADCIAAEDLDLSNGLPEEHSCYQEWYEIK